ncbi:NEW3 domain-containing protein [Lysobacter solisilvae (ex Woo and Kim 2020)]|uniref:Alpha-galactosidase NEW3 domain-containing protein n=1 Tax=Agrilutibacter terrestris TaxID=2865112 RepID=A0A7H0FXC5_9GAMM|nr:NEW3 domain-containing protein [Lysobacter terrestris]QNP40691.1 hypothetical protein H8B22_14730 [Lysobacter terrestris]
MTLASFDAEPLSGSPVVDKAPMISAVTTDFVMGKRPTGAANDIGAYEFGAGSTTTPTPPPTTTPTCMRAAPTLTVSGPTSTVAAGTTNTYSISLKNNDSAECSSTTFALARTVPSGWTGTLSAANVALAPGASTSASLAVTSSTTAAAGSYGIGVGTSSGAGITHTKSASATYSVAAASAGLTEAISTNKASYKAGETVYITARVTKNGVAVPGANVTFTALKPNKINTIELRGTTASNGYVTVSFVSGTGSSSIGTYALTSVATSGSLTTQIKGSFSVYK